MKVEIIQVSKSYQLVKMSFGTISVGDIEISEKDYIELGKPTVSDVIEITLKYNDKTI